MIDFIEWKENIVIVLELIANKEAQFQAWIVRNPLASFDCADEIMCMLYDDFVFEEFIEHNDLPLTLKKELAAFNIYLNSFLDSQPNCLIEKDFFETKEWGIIVNTSENLIDLLR